MKTPGKEAGTMADPAVSLEKRTDQRESRWRFAISLAVYVVLVQVADRITFAFFDIPYQVSPWYLPAGLTFAVLYLYGMRAAPAAFLATLLTSIVVRGHRLSSILSEVIIALLVAVIYGAAAQMLRRVIPIDPQFRRTRDFSRFILVTFSAALIVGVTCTIDLLAFGRIASPVFSVVLLNWWIGDVIGIVTLTPYILFTATREKNGTIPSARHVLEGMAWACSVILIIWLAFASPVATAYHLFYLVFLPLIWYALRHGSRGAILAVMVIGLSVMVALIAVGQLPLGSVDSQIFLLASSLSGLFLGAVVSERKQSEQALARERVFLGAAIELLPFPIIFYTPSGEVRRANIASFRFFASSDPEAWRQMKLLTADTRAPIPREDWPMMRAARGEVVPAIEGLISLPDGREVPVISYSAPIYLDRKLVASVVAFMDITQVKEADRAKNRFLDVLSHEMKTPITSIIGWTQAAQRDPSVVPQALEVILRNARRFRDTLNDLVDVSRLLHGKLVLHCQRTDLWQQAEMVAEDSNSLLQEHALTLTREPPTEPLIVDADPARLRQAIRNLIDNAIKYTESGGMITVTAQRKDREAVLSIQDTGKGIPPELLTTLFQAFNQTLHTETSGGLGMGLMLVKGLIELHGGHVSAISPGEGRGSTFTIRLPIVEANSDQEGNLSHPA